MGLYNYLLPISEHTDLAFNHLEDLLDNIDIKKFSKKIKFRGLNLSEQQNQEKINIIKNNLYELKTSYKKIDPSILKHNRNNKIDDEMWDNFFESVYEISPNIYLVKQSQKNNLFESCENKTFKCESYDFEDKQLKDLIEGKFVKKNKEYQYLGKNVDTNNLLLDLKYKKIKFQDTHFYYDENIKYEYDVENKEFNITQAKSGAKSFFYKGFLNDVNINFYGYKNKKGFDPPNYPIDQRGLTGCLSFILLNIENVSIKSNNSSCEDTINLINVKGSLNEIDITNSYRDALDIDFSKIKINRINVVSAGNDCVDLSKGKYKLNKLNLINCSDKALSIGEKSLLELNEIIVQKTYIGISTKDSSIAIIENIDIKESEKCLEAKRKKQEFSGAILNIKNLNCYDSIITTETGSFINKGNI